MAGTRYANAALRSNINPRYSVDMMSRRTFLWFAGTCVSTWPIVVFAQQSAKRQMLGFLLSETREGQESRLAALRTGLLERGYVEGRNIAIDLRSADGDYARLP